jgi:hypothetical protein
MVVGEGLLSAARFALRVVACGHALSLALESNLGRSFSSFPAWAEYLIADSFESSRTFESDGGGGRIRTFEVDDGRFTVCSLWPLGNPTRGNSNFEVMLEMVVGEGFEPSKSMTADLQSAPFGRSGTPPRGNAFTGLLPYREAGRIISNDAPL